MSNEIDSVTGERLLTLRQVAAMAGVPEVLVRCHIECAAIRGRLQKMHLFIPVQVVGRRILVRESDARRFADSRPGSTLAARKWLKRFEENQAKRTQGLRSEEIAALLEESPRKRRHHRRRVNPVLSDFPALGRAPDEEIPKIPAGRSRPASLGIQ